MEAATSRISAEVDSETMYSLIRLLICSAKSTILKVSNEGRCLRLQG